MKRHTAAALGALLILSTAGTGAAGDDGLSVRLEVRGRYYRAGDTVSVRIVVENETDKPITNRKGIPILSGLSLVKGSETIKVDSPPTLDTSTQPGVFPPGSGYMQILDLAEHFPVLAQPGRYELRFAAGDLEADPVELMLAPAFDTNLDYTATLKTDFGEITFDLLEAVAPDHVRNFVDLAKQDFYDETVFHVIAKGEVVMGGDKAGDGTGGLPYFLPPEISDLPHERGTLCSVRKGGPDNAAQFFINLRRKPEFDGNFTIFGRIKDGEEALAALESVATTGNNFQPFFKPLEDVFLRDVVIRGEPRPAEGEEDEGPAATEGR